MRHRTFRGAAALAVVLLLASAAIAFADTVPADGRADTIGIQHIVTLGKAGPGEVVTWPVQFQLTCDGTSHAAPGDTIQLDQASGTFPIGGAISATSTTLGPIPADWTPNGDACPSPLPTLDSTAPSTVTLTMPTTPGQYQFTISWARSGTTGLTKASSIVFNIEVVPNTPPHLSLPADLTVEAIGPTGAPASYTATATDDEDLTAPTPTCLPVSGSTFAVGTTTVNCSVMDGGGLTDTGSFHVTVQDTTAPILTLPADKTAEATGASGAIVAFSTSASDIVDGSVSVACDHASGDTFALGTTTVSCSAADAAGNPTSGSFHVTIRDTTNPSLTGMPSSMTLTTGNPAGATLIYTAPEATDVADSAPTVGCLPASGSTIPVGTTTVTCTATDASGNHVSASFTATVTFVSPISWTATWGEPVASLGDTFVGRSGRTIPIKVSIFADGVAQTSGQASVSVVGCAGGTPVTVALAWDGSRWTSRLDTSRLAGPGCYRVTAWLDGHAAGSFRLDLRGSDGATAASAPTATKASPQPRAKTKPHRRHRRV